MTKSPSEADARKADARAVTSPLGTRPGLPRRIALLTGAVAAAVIAGGAAAIAIGWSREATPPTVEVALAPAPVPDTETGLSDSPADPVAGMDTAAGALPPADAPAAAEPDPVARTPMTPPESVAAGDAGAGTETADEDLTAIIDDLAALDAPADPKREPAEVVPTEAADEEEAPAVGGETASPASETSDGPSPDVTVIKRSNLRAEPAPDAPVIAKVTAGSRVTRLDDRPVMGYYNVAFDGGVGWIWWLNVDEPPDPDVAERLSDAERQRLADREDAGD